MTTNTGAVARRNIGSRVIVLLVVVALIALLAVTGALALDLHDLRARCADAEQNPAPAIPACTALIEMNQQGERNLAISFVNRAIAWAKQNDDARAGADIARAIRIFPLERAYHVRGMLALRSSAPGAPKQALADFDRAIEINPAYAPAFGGRASAFARMQNYDRALAEANAAIRIRPDYAPAYVARGTTYARQRNFDRAIADLDYAIQLKPRQPSAFNNRGLAYRSKGDTTRALEDFNRAIELDPNHTLALRNRAATLRDQNQPARPVGDLGARPRAAVQPLPPPRPAPVPAAPAIAAPAAVHLAGSPPAPSRPVPAQPVVAKPVIVAQSPPRAQPPAQRSLADALAICERAASPQTRLSIEQSGGRGALELPACYHGRAHLDCIVESMTEEAGTIADDYKAIVDSNYPAIDNVAAICRIESRQFEEHTARATAFDARAIALQTVYDANATCVDKLHNTMTGIDLGGQEQSQRLMTSILDNIRSILAQAALRQREVAGLMQTIVKAQKSMKAIRGVHTSICR